MGKASRNKRDNLEVRRAAAEQKKKEAAQAKKRSLRNKIIGIICAVLAVVLIGGVIISHELEASGFYLRRVPAVATENYTMDGALASTSTASIRISFPCTAVPPRLLDWIRPNR